MSSYDPTDLKGEADRKEEQAEEARMSRLQEQADFRWLMRQRPFRRFVWKLLDECGVFRSTFSKDALVMALQEGARDVGLRLMEEIHLLSPDEYELMVRERREQREMKANG